MRLSVSRGGLLALVFLAVVAFLGAQEAPDSTAALIRQLGDSAYARREAAAKTLTSRGESALPALRELGASHESLEVRKRAQQIIRQIMLACRKSKSTGLELSLIDPGEFMMGSQRELGHRNDEQRHRVRITRPFLLGSHEVTQEEYKKVMDVNPSRFAHGGEGKSAVANKNTARFPVEQVTWFDAVDFCNRLSKLEKYQPYYKLEKVERVGVAIKRAAVTVAGGNGFRLPTEAEWEYACRARSQSAFHFGHSNSGNEANLKPGPAVGYGSAPSWPTLDRTTAVGSYKPNHFGLHDMHGNAAEWCWDWYDKDYYAQSPEADPTGPETGRHRVSRGGSWLVNERSCRSAARYWHTPDEVKHYAGFRVARSP